MRQGNPDFEIPTNAVVHRKTDKAGHSIGEIGKLSPMAVELMAWREALTLKDVQNLCSDTGNELTVAVLNAGAGLCTYASTRAGFRPLWFSEINDKQAHIVVEMTNHKAKRLKDTFGGHKPRNYKRGVKISELFTEIIVGLYKHVLSCGMWAAYMTTGMPCPDYTRMGSREGRYGKTGWQFVCQAIVIIVMRPLSFRLEMTDSLWEVDPGAYDELLEYLQGLYIVTFRVIPVIDFMDPSSRKRTFIVGFSKQLGPFAEMFEFPTPTRTDYWTPTARDIAVPDCEVPTEFWRDHNDPNSYDYGRIKRWRWYEPQPGKFHKIASAGDGI